MQIYFTQYFVLEKDLLKMGKITKETVRIPLSPPLKSLKPLSPLTFIK